VDESLHEVGVGKKSCNLAEKKGEYETGGGGAVKKMGGEERSFTERARRGAKQERTK